MVGSGQWALQSRHSGMISSRGSSLIEGRALCSPIASYITISSSYDINTHHRTYYSGWNRHRRVLYGPEALLVHLVNLRLQSVALAAIERVSHDREAQVSEMDANLMRSPRKGPALDETRVRGLVVA